MSTLNGQAIFLTALSGLNNTFATLSQGTGSLTLEQITNPNDDINLNSNNQTFVQYLTNNFGNIDKDGDGKITSKDINNITNNISKYGMTYDEIVQLCSTNANSSLLTTVLTYFNEIDKNGDGRVTDSEIRAYGCEADRFQAELEYNSFDASNFSIYYGDDNAVDKKPSSILSYKYPTNNQS